MGQEREIRRRRGEETANERDGEGGWERKRVEKKKDWRGRMEGREVKCVLAT